MNIEKILEDDIVITEDNAVDIIEELQKRINKTIEYIKEICWIDDEYGYCNYGDDLRPEHIVNILEGSDKE